LTTNPGLSYQSSVHFALKPHPHLKQFRWSCDGFFGERCTALHRPTGIYVYSHYLTLWLPHSCVIGWPPDVRVYGLFDHARSTVARPAIWRFLRWYQTFNRGLFIWSLRSLYNVNSSKLPSVNWIVTKNELAEVEKTHDVFLPARVLASPRSVFVS
jgi:hypothetical protein